MRDDHTDRLKVSSTRMEGVPTLEESTTRPSSEKFAIPKFPVKAIEKLFDQFFLALPDSVLSRGLPFIDRIYFDDTLRLPHIWIKLKVAFQEPSKATITAVREELEILASLMARFFDRGVAVSAEIDPGEVLNRGK